MRFGQLRLGLAPFADGEVPPPTDIAWAGTHEVAEDADLGTVVGGALTGTDPQELDLTFSMADGDERFDVVGTSVILIGVLDFETAETHSITIRATNTGGAFRDEVFVVTVNDVSETAPENPLPPGDVVEDNHEIVPYATEVNGAIKIAGKKNTGGVAKFVYDIGALLPNERYIIEYDPDFSQLADDGENVFVGFVLKTGLDFHMVGLKGDGAGGLDAYKISGDGLWNAGSGFTEDDGGAPAHGTQAGPNFIKLDVSSDGSTITFSTAASEIGPWTEEYAAYIPHPFSAADDATTFGIGGFFPAGSTGPYSIAITQWIESSLYSAWDPDYTTAGITLSNGDHNASASTASNKSTFSTAPIYGTRKVYFELEMVSIAVSNVTVGVSTRAQLMTIPIAPTSAHGQSWNSNGTSVPFGSIGFATGDRLGIAYDPATGGIWGRKNGTWTVNDPTGAPNATITHAQDRMVYAAITILATAQVQLVTDPALFENSAPSGFLPLEVFPRKPYAWSTTEKTSTQALSENNTKITKSSTGYGGVRMGTEPCDYSQKQVFAVQVTADGAGSTAKAVGITDLDDTVNSILGSSGFSIGYRSGGTVVQNGSTLQTYSTWGAVNDIIMIAVDNATLAVWFGLNGVWNGDPAADTGEVGNFVNTGANRNAWISCGSTDAGDAFKLIDYPYAVPSGFIAPPIA